MSRWPLSPGSTSGCAGEECTTFGRYCVSDGVPPRTYTTAYPDTYDPKIYPPRRGSMTLNVEPPGHTREQPDRPKKAAREAVALALTIFHRCGYFMAFPKCSLEPTTDLVFLGVGCDTAQRRFYGPEDKLRILEVILRDAIDSRNISFSQLNKLTGKCTSVAVSPARLYTHHMYRQIAVIKCSEGRKNLSSIVVSKHSGLRFEMERWLEVRARLNGVPWYDAPGHVLTISGATDASSQTLGGLIR